jgi:ABC-type lipoprotein release transport system permease subunit
VPAEVITAALSLVGTLVGTLGGIALSSNLTNYRIEQLEKKVEKHNNLITRTYKLEQEFAVMDEKLKVANHRIDDLEDLEHES